MSGFPTLRPFATIIAAIDPPRSIGARSTGGNQVFVNITSATIATESGVSPALNATAFIGGDWIHADPDGKHLRLDVRSVFKTEDELFITVAYTGIITLTPDIGKILSGAPDAKTVDFGNIAAVPTFVAGHDKYKFLENSVYVMSGRFTVGENGTSVEYKISEVIA